MKTKLQLFASLLLLSAVLISCGKDNDPAPVDPTLNVSPNTAIAFSATATESFDVTVTTNQSSWEVVSDQSWCVIQKESGKFKVTALPNTATTASTPAIITVTAGTATPVRINVTQAGAGAELTVNPNTPISFTSTGGASEVKTINVATNQSSWNVASTQTWCTVSKSGNTFTITASANTGAEQRSAVVTVSATNAANVTINVTQAGVGAQLSISPNVPISFTKTGGASEAKTITVTTNQASWDAVSNQTWCTIAKSGNQFTITASTNTATTERKATITVSAGGASAVMIEVTQAGVVAGASVGDYYYDDGSFSTELNNSKVCLGIVFRVKTETQSGLVVYYRQSVSSWGDTNKNTQATNRDNGAYNLEKIKIWYAWEGSFPAFRYCNDLGEGWYLPAINELVDLYNTIKGNADFNTKLSAIPNVRPMSGNYWSSTQSSMSNAYAVISVESLQGDIASMNKYISISGDVKARPVRAF